MYRRWGKKLWRLLLLKLKNHHKNLILLKDVDIDDIQAYRMVSSIEKNYKYFIGYMDHDYKTKPLCIMLPKTSAYVKTYDDETKLMHFSIKDDEFLKQYNVIWKQVSNSMKRGT